MMEVRPIPRFAMNRNWVLLVVVILLGPIAFCIARMYYELALIHDLAEAARRLGGIAEVPEGGIDFPWALQIQLIVGLADPRVDDEEFARLERMPGFKHVQILNLQGSRITDKSVDLLENHPGLIALSLSRTEVTDKGMESLAKLPALNDIGLDGTTVTDAGLDTLIRSRRYLVGIDLNETQVTEEGLKRLKKAFPQVYITPGAPRGP